MHKFWVAIHVAIIEGAQSEFGAFVYSKGKTDKFKH